MDNIQIKMASGEVLEVEMISCFELINIKKNYIFYTKNEVVENNLIKMYVAEMLDADEVVSIGSKMTDEEWTNLKNVMKSILTGNVNTNVNYIEIGGV